MRVKLKKDGRKVKLWGLDEVHEDIVREIIEKIPYRKAMISDPVNDPEGKHIEWVLYGDIDPESIEYEPNEPNEEKK